MTELRIAWVTRSFLDYRIPVFKSLSEIDGVELFLIYSGDYVPETVNRKAKELLGDHAISMQGEWKIGPEDSNYMANQNISIRLHPGLIREIRKVKPDVLVCDGLFKWALSALIYRFLFGIPIVINYERTFHTERNCQWYRTLYRRLVVRFIDAMDCSGRHCKEYSEWLGMPAERITTGHMVADTKGLSDKVELLEVAIIDNLRKRWQVEGTLIIYVGRLHPRKGCAAVLEAWKEIEKKTFGKATLMLIGTGEQEHGLKQFCKKEQLKCVRFTGYVPYDELYIYYAASDVLIIPTFEDNWSLVVPEAMACGLPILCSTYNGCWPELVHEGVNGWVFNPRNPNETISIIENCISQKDKLHMMGQASVEIIQEYSPHNAAKSVLDACEIAINNKD